MAEYDTVAIVGVGLIGGSIGLALRERKLAQKIIGIGRRQQTLDVARKLGAIDHGVTNLANGVSQAQLIIVATPVDTIAERVVQASAACPAAALITDAGSTKLSIVAAVDAGLAARRSGPRFVGSHPLAGDHRTGPEHARGDLFEDRVVVITPTEHTRPAAVTEISGFWESLGANIRSMKPSEHDAALAITSHLPHIVAIALAAATPTELLPLTAGGWRDTTRIAAADPELWGAIFTANRERVLEAIDQMDQVFGSLRESLEQGDNETLRQILETAAKRKRERDALGD
ncbi:MAG TPA: prephenate dehydrogenase/arogenate dehydrogenase family protein [Lacipirellulaceae bacterium]|jgi:prephenate dehydrogenase|nr:prephenate dehydrogenase/arogenate dehydrogenase family protein [Lacipirellulaceae bacterium]